MTTTVFTLERLRQVLRKAAGEMDHLDGDILDVPFKELEVDSLCLLEIASILESEHKVQDAEDVLRADSTPREVVAHVNGTKSVGHVDNRVVITAPYDHVWEVTNDVAGWPDLFSEYASAEVLDQEADSVTFRLTTVPDERGTQWSWVSERHMDKDSGTVRAWRIEKGPFAHMEIFWEYRAVPGGVQMRWVQDFHLRADAPLDDAAMEERMNRNTVVQMARIKHVLEQSVGQV